MTSPARIVALATIFVALASMSCSTSIRLLPPAGVTELRARAELGIAGAQFNLGVMYLNDAGVRELQQALPNCYISFRPPLPIRPF